jgi:DNA-binding HxlR family transcriptional regulator
MRTTMLINRSVCPISSSLDVLGDRWSLLILRDMIYFGKKTYGEFLQSDEKIARNILASRLMQLQENGLITKVPFPADGRKDEYRLLEPGLDTVPMLLDLAEWGALHRKNAQAPKEWIAYVQSHRAELIPLIQSVLRDGGSIFAGDNSVVAKLHVLQ